MIVKLGVGISLSIMTLNHNCENWSIICQSLNKTHPSINYHYHDNGVVMLLDTVSLLLTPLLHGGELVFIGAFLSTRRERQGEREEGREGGRERGGERGREGGREREREREQ